MTSSLDQISDEDKPEEDHAQDQVKWRGGLLFKPSILFFILFLAASASALYFYNQNRVIRQNPASVAEEEIRQVVTKVGQLIVLPEGETPTLATVTDPEKLKGQPFFAKTKIGDKVLIYTGARKAILYDPVAHKIVEVAVLNIGQ